jgi:hypothetical protein
MKQKREHSFAQRMMDYAEKSSKEALGYEMEMFHNIEKVYTERMSFYACLREPKPPQTFKYNARRISKVKVIENAIAMGTVDGRVDCFDTNIFGSDIPRDTEHNFTRSNNKVFGAPVQNIFYDNEFVFLSREGKVHALSLAYDMNIFVQQSDYHNGLSLLMCTNEDNDIFAHDLQALKPIFKSKAVTCTSLKIHGNGNVFVYSSGSACFVDIRSMKTVVRLGENVASSLFLNDHLICTSSANLIQAFDLRNLDCIGNVLSHLSPVRFLEASREVLYSGTFDGELCVSSPALSLIHREANIKSIECMSADDTRVLACTSDNILQLIGP